MRFILAICASLLGAGVVEAACVAVQFDYSGFSRPPGPFDLDRYVAGREDGNYLSVGLNGVTLQISPANTAQDQDIARIWEDWRVAGTQHPDFEVFHRYHTPPQLVETPFSTSDQAYRSVQTDGGPSVIEFLFLSDRAGQAVATLYLNDPTGEADLAAVREELAPLMRVDFTCVAEGGRYDGIYDPAAGRFLVLPMADFPIEDPAKLP